MKVSPETIVKRYWSHPWTFKANGDLHIHHPAKRIVFKQVDYLPKAQRGTDQQEAEKQRLARQRKQMECHFNVLHRK